MGIIINGQNDTIGPVDNSMSLLGTVSIGGTMTIEDFTNIDSVGLITARNGLQVTGGNVAIGHNNPSYMLHLKQYGNNEIVLNNTRGSSLGGLGQYDNHLEVSALSNHPLLLKTNSVERIRITSAGNIGINDSNPTAKLSVVGNAYVSADSFMGENAGIFFSGWNDYGAGVYGRNSGNDLVMNAGSGEKVRITSGGLLDVSGGIQVSENVTPTSGAGLELFREGNGGGQVQAYDRDNNASLPLILKGSQIQIFANGTERFRIRSDGRVTIGTQTINTNSMLSIHRSSSDESQIRFTNTTTGEGGNNGLLVGIDSNEHGRIFNQENSPLRFGTNNTERLRIEAGGFVGLGTNNPYHELHIQGSGDTRALITSGGTGDAVMMFENASGNTWGHGIDLTNNNYVIAYNNTSDPSLTTDGKVEITTAGRLGVGIENPNSNLHVLGGSDSTDNLLLTLQSNGVASDGSLSTGLRLINSTSTTSIHGADIRAIRTGSTAADLAFSLYDGNSPQTERLRITSSGMVGINMTPSTVGNSTYMLQMYSPGAQCFMSIGNGTSSNGPLNGLVIGNDANNAYVYNREATTLKFGTSNADRLFIDSDGNMGLGVAPAYSGVFGGSQRVLHIGGTTAPGLRIQSSTSNQGDFIIQAGNSGGATYLSNLSNNADTVFYTTSGGSIGERLRINATGPISANPNSGDGDDFAATALKRDWNAWADIFYEGWIGGNNGWGTFWAGSTGAAYRRVSGDSNPNEYVFIGAGSKRFTFDLDVGGNAYFDGSLSQNNYDYAEYFEWEDGNPNNEDRRGYSVFLNANGKIEKATSETSTSDIIGVISGTAAIIGDAAVYDWQGRYEIDEWGTRRKEQVTQVSWTDIDGTKHSYADENDVPSDVVVPDDASRRIHHRYIESSTYDSSQAYVPRDQRREWGIVGLLGKVRVRNDSPKHPNWKYIKTIAGKDLWLIK